MTSTSDRIDKRLDRIDQYYDAAPPEVKEEVDDLIPWDEIYRINNSTAVLDHVRSYIAEAARDRENNDRSKPLCRCANASCPIKDGEIHPKCVPRPGPDMIEPGADVRIRRFIASDHPDVVTEEAYDDFMSGIADVLPDLTRAASKLQTAVEGEAGLV